MSWKKWGIRYLNPNIPGSQLKWLSRTVKARNKQEADKKAARELATTGMLFETVELL